MALKLTGEARPVKALGTLQQVSKDKVAASAVRQADDRRRESSAKRGGDGGRKAR